MKNILWVMLLFTVGFNLYAMQNNPQKINIAGLEKEDVLKALYGYAQKKSSNFLNMENRYHELTESEIDWIEHELHWHVDNWHCNLFVDLSQDEVNVEVFNTMYGPNAAQKAIKPLKSHKVLLS